MKFEKIGEKIQNTDFVSKLSKFKMIFLKTLKNEDGQGLTEYALIVGVIALVCITAMSTLGGNVYDAFFSKIQAFLSSSTT